LLYDLELYIDDLEHYWSPYHTKMRYICTQKIYTITPEHYNKNEQFILSDVDFCVM